MSGRMQHSNYEEYMHGGHGIGAINEERIKVLDTATAHHLRILEKIFQKRTTHLITCLMTWWNV